MRQISGHAEQMRRLAGERLFRQMQIPKVYRRRIEESACRRGRKRQRVPSGRPRFEALR